MEDYADTITAERIKRVINGYGDTEGTGGGFTYYELGERLLLEDGNINESLPIKRVYEYIWYTETRASYTPQNEDYLLGIQANTAYYFYYDKEQITSLDHGFLSKIKTIAGNYLIYADINTLSTEELDAMNIRFKKIPRDITKM
jgi:adenine-specific DNA-methyltransferase